MLRVGMACVALLLLAGCSVPQDAGFTDVKTLASDRIGKRVHWKKGSEEDALVAGAVKKLLSEPLTADTAVEVALLNNPELQAVYEDLGVAQAEVVQAGMLKNPTFIGEARFGRSSDLRDIDLDFLQDFLDLITRPARTRIAGLEFERTKQRAGHAVVEVAATARRQFFALQGAMNVAAVQSRAVSASEASFALARELQRAGNLSDLDLARNQASYEQARVELVRLDGDAFEAREALNRVLGVFGRDTAWTIGEKLPPVPDEDEPLDDLERAAVARRLDLTAARTEVATLAEVYGMTNDYRWLGELQLGPSAAERPEVSRWVGGFIASIQLPIFDQGQARVARAEALLRAGRFRLEDLAVEIRSEVRAARYRLLVARNVARHYRKVLVPLQERIVELAQRYNNFMLTSTFELLEAKRHELETYEDYVKATRDYWLARSELERLVGGRLGSTAARSPAPPPEKAPEAPPAKPSGHEHH